MAFSDNDFGAAVFLLFLALVFRFWMKKKKKVG